MPNWCENHFSIEGPRDAVKALWDSIQAGKESNQSLLSAMVPIGEWEYDKAIDAWGTKWDVDSENMEYTESTDGITATLAGAFDSAWSPPVDAFAAWCEANPEANVQLSFFEPGARYTGVWDNESGLEEFEIDTTDYSEIPDSLMEEFNIASWFDDEADEQIEDE